MGKLHTVIYKNESYKLKMQRDLFQHNGDDSPKDGVSILLGL